MPIVRGWILWLIGVGILGALAVVIVLSIRSEQEDQRQAQQKYEELKKQGEAQQREFENTPEGKKVKAAREKAERKAEVQKLTRLALANMVEKDMLKAGYDIKTALSEEKLPLYVTGEPVNRVFAYQFMRVPKLVKSMRDAGFKTVTFWNGHRLTGIFTQDYDLTK